VDLVPICRNRSGSAFLRWQGLSCRHGSASESAQAPALFGDCDVVINTIVPIGTPRETRRADEQIIHNMVAHSKPCARLVYFSTAMVYGNPRPGLALRIKSEYARTKLRGERLFAAVAKASGREFYILRLGHVCGELQNITRGIRDKIGKGDAILPERDCISNSVYTASIAEAMLLIAAGRVSPGTYDLMNNPQWTWRLVYEHEARQCGTAIAFRTSPCAHEEAGRTGLLRWPIKSALKSAHSFPMIRECGRRILSALPSAANDHWHASWLQSRAAREIAELSASRPRPPEETSWVPLGRAYICQLSVTKALLENPQYRVTVDSGRRDMSPDLRYQGD